MYNLKYYFIILIFGVLFISCEKDDPTVIDPSLSFPKILSAYVTPNVYDTIYLNSIIGATITSDIQISSVTARVLNPGGLLLRTIDLKDDGVAPDTTAGDGKYTARMNFTLDCKYVGAYSVQIVAENTSGLQSNVFNVGFNMTNTNNHKPFLTNLICPDSLRRATGNGGDTNITVAFLQAMGNDPDGNCDVRQVYFNSFSPTGTPNHNNPFQMFDDGNILLHGDTVAGDFKWSLLIQLPPNQNDSTIGNFTFKFNAQDYGNLVSDTITKLIRIHR